MTTSESQAASPDDIKSIFYHARELSTKERERYLASHGSGAAGIRARVEALLAADASAGSFLSSPTRGAGSSSTNSESEVALLQRALAGRFSLDHEIGRGGMGVVYLAHDIALRRPVAIKLLPSAMAQRPEYRARFLHEVRTAAGLSHPNIVPIHLVEAQDDVICFVMSFVDGETLRTQVERNGPLSPGDATRVMQEVAWALAHAHQRGFVHRDVKPDNILIERSSGRALVTDFGIARALDSAAVTAEDIFIGTPLFASPEQALGHPTDGRSDVYSLGASMFFALTARPLFDGQTAQAVLSSHIQEPPPPIGALRPDIPRQLSHVIDQCLAKAPSARHQSAEDLAKALNAVSLAPEVPEPIRRVAREVNLLSVDVAVTVAYCLAAAAGWYLDRQTANGFLRELGAYVTIVWMLVGGVMLGARIADAILEARGALMKGYGEERIRRQLRESVSSDPPRQNRRSVLTAIMLTLCTFVIVACWWYSFYAPFPPIKWLNDPMQFIAILGPFLIGRVLTRRALLRQTRGLNPLRWLAARIGGAIVHLAAWRIPRSSRPDDTAHKTEVVLGNSAESLFARLPTVYRDSLKDMPDLVRRLEKHADALRGRRDEIERALAEAGSARSHSRGPTVHGSAAESLRAHSDAARASLTAAHDAAGARLADVIAALEALRLGLLRLRAGVATPVDLTSDLELAWQVGLQVDALLHGAGKLNAASGWPPITPPDA